jgi:hypothetical protein
MAEITGKLYQKGGKWYILPEKGEAVAPAPKPGAPGLQPVKPVIRPIVANPEILFHTVKIADIKGKARYDFFTVYPDPNLLNGNYGTPYIKRKMILQALKVDFLPTNLTSHIDMGAPANTYNFMDVFNAITEGFLRIKINRQTVFEFSCQDLMPPIRHDWELINATGPVYKVIHTIDSSKFTPFKDLVGVESHYVTDEDEVYVELELPSALSYAETLTGHEISKVLKIRVSLLTRPQRKPYVG